MLVAARSLPAPRTPALAGALLWRDDFDGPAGQAPSSAHWTSDTGRWGTSSGENQYYTAAPANAALDGNGNLAIVARHETTPDNVVPSAPGDNAYTSARIVTRGIHEHVPPVRIAARIKAPWTPGLLPAFWTVGDPETSWPSVGEIDIVEWPAHKGNCQVQQTIHGPLSGTPTTDQPYTVNASNLVDTYSNAFHVYGADWFADHIDFHIDGQIIGTVTQAQYQAANGVWSSPFGSSPTAQFVQLNLAVGNNWTGDPTAASVFPQTMLVDWVAAWSI